MQCELHLICKTFILNVLSTKCAIHSVYSLTTVLPKGSVQVGTERSLKIPIAINSITWKYDTNPYQVLYYW